MLAKHSRRLLLVALDYTRPKDPPLSLGQASILAQMNSLNLDVIPKSWSVNNPAFRPEEVVNFFMSQNHSDVDAAIGAFVWNEEDIQFILNDLKRLKFKGRILLGGPQISYTKNEPLEGFYPQADIFIRGSGENALSHLMAISPSDISAIDAISGVHRKNAIDKLTMAKVDPSSLPSPYLTGLLRPQRFLRWETKRGCMFSCAFCQHRQPGKSGAKTPGFDEDRVLAEAAWIMSNPVIQDIAVLDPVFNGGGDMYLDVMDALKGFTGKLSLQCRIEFVTDEFLDKVQEINKTGRVVLEFGLQTIHKAEMQAINRQNNIKRADSVLQACRDRLISTEVSLIFGLPNQTLSSFTSSVQFCIDRSVPVIHAFPLMLLRGTPLYENKAKYGLVEACVPAWGSDSMETATGRIQRGIPHVISSASFSEKDWREMGLLSTWLEEHYNPRSLCVVQEAQMKSDASSVACLTIWRISYTFGCSHVRIFALVSHSVWC